MKRRVLSLIMAIVLCFTMLPTSALAQEVKTPAASAPVADTKDIPKVADPTAAPTAAGTTPTVAATTPADTTPTVAATIPTEVSVPATEDGTLAAEGEVATQNGEGVAVQSGEYVAEVDGIQYDTLEEALDHVDEGEITLLDNISVEVLEIYGATINMNGHSITSAIEAYDSLTLKDGTVNGTVKVDGGTFTLTAAGAEVAINGGLDVISGSCNISGAKVGVKGTLTFGGDDMVITGTEKAVELTKAAEPTTKTFYGSATESGAASTEAVFKEGTYKVGSEVAKRLTSEQEGVTPPAPVTLTLDSAERNATAGETVTFSVTYTGADTLNAYIQKSAQNENFDVRLERAEDGTYTVSVKIDAETPDGSYTLFVHEVSNTSVQAMATIHVTALTPVAEVNGNQYALLNNAFAAANDGDTVKMLANHVTDEDAIKAGDFSTLAIVTKKLTLDLSGNTIDYLMVGDVTRDGYDEATGEYQHITYTPGDLTVVNTSGGSMGKIIDLDLVKGTLDVQSGQLGDDEGGQLTCNKDSGTVTIRGGMVRGLTVGKGATVTFSGGSIHAGNWFNDGTLNITGGEFGSVQFYNRAGTIAIRGGTFGTIRNCHDDSTLIPPMLLLAKGYAFYEKYGDTVKDGSKADLPLTGVTVKTHTHTIENGKCDCGIVANVRDSNDGFYNTLQAALNAAAASDGTIKWVQLETDLTEQVTFDAAGASVTVKMNGKTLTAPYCDAPALTVSGGTLTFADAATISMPTTADNNNRTITYAVSISGGKLVFQGRLTAKGGVFNILGNLTKQAPAVYANGGELDFRGDLDLEGGLTVAGSAKLTQGLTKGTFWTGCHECRRLSVEDSENYSYLEYLLEDGYAFVDKDDPDVFRCVSSFTFWTGNVTIVPHKHTWAPNGELYSCTACGKACGHPDGYSSGQCPVCGKPCPHAIADQSPVDHKNYCNDCGKQMFARIQTKPYAWSHFTNLKDAMAAAEDGQTILLLDDINHSGEYACLTGDNKTVTLDLNGHSITEGWIQVGIDRNWDNYTSATLKIVGSGSFTTSGTLSVGYKATLDLSDWTGSTISSVNLSKNGKEESNPESLLIVSENTGTIGALGFLNWPSSGIKTKLNGGTYGEISVVVQYDSEPYSSMLAPGYAFQYTDSGEFVEYTKAANYSGSKTIYNVKVVKCTHGGTSGFDIESRTCPYCGTPAVAQTVLKNVEGNPWRSFANLQDALNADRDGGSAIQLLTDVGGDYTIDSNVYTGLNLNRHSLNGKVTLTGKKGSEVAFSTINGEGTVKEVVAYENAKLAGSGAAAVIEKLTLAEGATWANILSDPGRLGYQHYTDYPDQGSYKWYAPADVPTDSKELTNVKIQSLPITSNSLSFRVDGKSVYSVERGTTVQLCAFCNAKDADVYIYTGVPVGNGTFTFSQKKAEYKKIDTTWYYVVDFDAKTIGTYGFYFTATKDGYSVSSELETLEVTKLELSKAKITFTNGNESVYQPYNDTRVPLYVVTYNGNELKEGVDYTVVSGDSRSRIGNANLTIEATDNGDYTGRRTARWKVVTHKATISVGDIIKAYDGTTDLPANAAINLKSADSRYSPSGGALPLVAGTDYQILNAHYDSANASENEKIISFTINLRNKNYVFEDGTMQKDFVLNGADVSQTFKINKAPAPTNIQTGTLNVINGTTLTYTYDFSQLLPELSGNASFGEISYGNGNVTGLATGYHVIGTARVNETTGALTLRLESVFSTGQLPPSSTVGTVSVRVYTTNFQTFLLELNLNPIDQIKPVADGEITVTEITYDDALSKSEISGKMKDPNTDKEIPGTFTWTDGTLMFNAGNRKAEWTFTPAAPEYAAVTGNAEVKVNRKSIVGADVKLENTFVYDGTEKWPQIISVVLDGVTLTGVGRGTDYGFSCNRTSQVGTYYDDFSIGGQGNYTGELKFTWSITPREVTPTITVADGVYDGGNPVQPTVTLTDDLGNTIDPKEYDVSYSDNTSAGIGTVTITDKEGGNYVLGTASTTFTINKAAAPTLTAYQVTQKYSLKAEQTITLPDLESLGMPDDAQVSDANAFHSGSYSPTGKIENGWGIDVNTGAITYALADGATAGDVITFTLLVRSKNYEDATVTVILTLTERDAPILTLPDITTVDYTGAEIPVSAVTGKSAAFDGKDVPGTWSWKAGQAITNVTDTGSKTIVFTPDDLVNYHPVEGEVYVIISRVAPDYTAPTAIDGLIYSGNAQALVNAGSTAHGKLLYSQDKDGAYSETIPTGTNAGEYTVWYKVAGDNNHKDSQPASVTVTVAPKAVTATVTVSGDSLTYTGDPLKPDVIVKDGDTVISPDEYDVSYKDNVNAGTATVTIKNKAGGNYTVSGSTTFEIGKAASEVRTVPTANTGLVYNGGEQTLITAGTALGGKLKYRLGETGEFTEALPKATDAGTYTVYYMVEGDGNHRDSEVQSLTVTIDKAKVTVKALDKSIYTDDKAPDLSKPVLDKDYTVSAMFGEDALTGDIKLAYVDASGAEITPDTTKVGKVIIRASGLTAPNGNYTVVFVDGTLTIDERPVYTIKATAGIHGSITPSGDIDVLHGGSQTFTIAANSGYAISNVKIDGVSIGAVKSYTFENVTGNHTIEVTFMKANGNPQTGVMVDEVTGEYYVG